MLKMQFTSSRFFTIAFVLIICIQQEHALSLREERQRHTVKAVNEDEMFTLAKASNMSNFETILDAILVPRVVGTPNHDRVKTYLRETMKNLGWKVTSDKFNAQTPLGTLQFENIVAAINPNARRFLVLACHYDSKYFREGNFVGATDSAVPCAMMINLAYTMRSQLNTIKNQNRVSLKFIFFDGEEAFRHWSATDSIYGSRHLAAKWEQTLHPKNNRDGTTLIHSIDILILLDLLGAPDPLFYSYFANTDKWYRMLIKSESKLAELRLLNRYSVGKPEQTYFQQLSANGGIEDDHIPFLQRGVPILHIIPHPFPDVWHTARDNRDAIDMSTVENLLNIFRVFITSYLGLPI